MRTSMAISMRRLFTQQGGTGTVISLRRLLATAGAKSLRAAAGSSHSAGSGELTGAIAAHYRSLGAERGPLGRAISTNVQVANGQMAFFQYGTLWTGGGADTVFYADYAMPLLGHPTFLSPLKAASLLSLIVTGHSVPGLTPQQAPATSDIAILRDAMTGHWFLKPVDEAPTVASLIPLAVHDRPNGLKFAVAPDAISRLRDRQLYDIVLQLPGGTHEVISAHAVYVTTSSWENFSFAHITDIHVTARADAFQRKLQRLAETGEVSSQTLRHFNNFNDNFSAFIRYVNRLHARGEIDFVLATGDLVDYLFEKSEEDAPRGGNFALFKSIVLGQRASTDGRAGEELRVPLFTTLGNHDYRLHPYRLLNKVAITASDVARDGIFGRVGDAVGSVLDFLGADKVGVKVFERSEYSPYNLTKKEAVVLDGEPATDAQGAAKLLEVDESMRDRTSFYFREFSRQRSYAVDLGGRHQVVMIDTKHDSGITTDVGAVLAAKLGIGREDSKKFVAGFVNSEGLSTGDIELVKRALDVAPGLVIVGMHAPPLCHAGKEFSHFFRESEHTRAPRADTIHFLMRHHQTRLFPPLTEDRVGIAPGATVSIRELPAEVLRGWQVDDTRFFRKAARLDDNIAEGIADGSDEFLALCVGRGARRKVNLVLCGHNHSNVEYRLGLDAKTGDVEYYLDYYSTNPARYYNSREFAAGKREVAITLDATAKKPGPLDENAETRPDGRQVRILHRTVPQNVESLDHAADRAEWWASKSPLIVQTPAVGPIDKNQRSEENDDAPIDPSFQGVRVIDVRADVIQAIRLLTVTQILEDVSGAPVLEAA